MGSVRSKDASSRGQWNCVELNSKRICNPFLPCRRETGSPSLFAKQRNSARSDLCHLCVARQGAVRHDCGFALRSFSSPFQRQTGLLHFVEQGWVADAQGMGSRLTIPGSGLQRSEEHTSELQSLAYLVC